MASGSMCTLLRVIMGQIFAIPRQSILSGTIMFLISEDLMPVFSSWQYGVHSAKSAAVLGYVMTLKITLPSY